MIVLMIDNDDQPFSSRSSAWMTRGVSKAFEFSGRNDSYWSRQNRGALSFTSFTLLVCVRFVHLIMVAMTIVMVMLISMGVMVTVTATL